MLKVLTSASLLGAMFLTTACSGNADVEARSAEISERRTQFMDKVNQLPSNDLQHRLRMTGEEFYFLAQMDFEAEEFKHTIEGPRYEASPFYILRDFRSLDKMQAAYVEGLIFEANSASPEHVDVKPPFTYPFEHSFEWKTISFSNNLQLGLDTPNANVKPIARAGAGKGYVLDWQNVSPLQAKYVTADFVSKTPMTTEILTFRSDDREKWTEMGEYRIRLVKMDGIHLRFEVQTREGEKPLLDDDDFLFGAKDHTGRYLQFVGGGTGSEREKEVMLKAIDLAVGAALKGDIASNVSEQDFNKTLASLVSSEKAPTVFTMDVYFHGNIEEVDVIYTAESTTTNVDVSRQTTSFTAPNARDASIADIPNSAVIFDHDAEHVLNTAMNTRVYDLTGDQVKNSVENTAIRLGDGAVIVRFDYPSVPSEVFYRNNARFGIWEEEHSFTAFDKSGSIIKPNYTATRVFENRMEIDETAYARKPHKGEGHVTIKIAPKMSVEQVAASALPAGLQIKGNKVIADPEFIDQEVIIYAVDENGRPLKVIDEVLYPRPHLYQRATYYYGAPSSLILFRQGGEQNVRYDFDISFDAGLSSQDFQTK